MWKITELSGHKIGTKVEAIKGFKNGCFKKSRMNKVKEKTRVF